MSAAVGTVLRFWTAGERGDDDRPGDVVHEEIEVHDFDLPDAGVYHGYEGVQRWVADWSAPWEEWSVALHDLLDLGSQVASFTHLEARTASGLKVDREDSQLFTVRDGRIAKLEYFGNADTAIERCLDPARAARRRTGLTSYERPDPQPLIDPCRSERIIIARAGPRARRDASLLATRSREPGIRALTTDKEPHGGLVPRPRIAHRR